jgi:hypothetical protein
MGCSREVGSTEQLRYAILVMVGVTGAKASTQRGEFYSMFLDKMHEQNIDLARYSTNQVYESTTFTFESNLGYHLSS